MRESAEWAVNWAGKEQLFRLDYSDCADFSDKTCAFERSDAQARGESCVKMSKNA